MTIAAADLPLGVPSEPPAANGRYFTCEFAFIQVPFVNNACTCEGSLARAPLQPTADLLGSGSARQRAACRRPRPAQSWPPPCTDDGK
jgi:hypothetical protein